MVMEAFDTVIVNDVNVRVVAAGFLTGMMLVDTFLVAVVVVGKDDAEIKTIDLRCTDYSRCWRNDTSSIGMRMKV